MHGNQRGRSPSTIPDKNLKNIENLLRDHQSWMKFRSNFEIFATRNNHRNPRLSKTVDRRSQVELSVDFQRVFGALQIRKLLKIKIGLLNIHLKPKHSPRMASHIFTLGQNKIQNHNFNQKIRHVCFGAIKASF